MPSTISFEEAINRSDGRKLVLGNGFSIALRPDTFSYAALRDRARPDGISDPGWAAFDHLGTSDFEVVMKALRTASQLVEWYEGHGSAMTIQMQSDASALREILVRTIAASHPGHPFEIEEASYAACRRFLSHFNIIYSLNYDLLLYWTLIQEMDPVVACDDGFRDPEVKGATYVTWDPNAVSTQNVHTSTEHSTSSMQVLNFRSILGVRPKSDWWTKRGKLWRRGNFRISCLKVQAQPSLNGLGIVHI